MCSCVARRVRLLICTQAADTPHAKGKNTSQQYTFTSVATTTCGGERNNRKGWVARYVQ